MPQNTQKPTSTSWEKGKVRTRRPEAPIPSDFLPPGFKEHEPIKIGYYDKKIIKTINASRQHTAHNVKQVQDRFKAIQTKLETYGYEKGSEEDLGLQKSLDETVSDFAKAQIKKLEADIQLLDFRIDKNKGKDLKVKRSNGSVVSAKEVIDEKKAEIKQKKTILKLEDQIATLDKGIKQLERIISNNDGKDVDIKREGEPESARRSAKGRLEAKQKEKEGLKSGLNELKKDVVQELKSATKGQQSRGQQPSWVSGAAQKPDAPEKSSGNDKSKEDPAPSTPRASR